MDFRDMTINDFAQGIAGEHTIAGGGSVSALAGAYGAALVSMVSRKTLQNKKYVDVYDQFEALLADTQPKLETFLDGIQDDITAFEVFERALAMPKDTEEEKTARKAAMQEGQRRPFSVWFLTNAEGEGGGSGNPRRESPSQPPNPSADSCW